MANRRLSTALVIVLLAVSALALLTSACGKGTPAKPTMEILSPPSGTEAAVGEKIEVQYRATDPVAVVRVELELEAQIVDSQNSPVAEGQPSLTGVLRWTPEAPGTYSLVAYAYNRDRVASAPVGVNIIVVGEVALGPTATPIGAASPTPTRTPAPTPTQTPTPTPTQTPVPKPSFGPITFATGRTADFKPINPGTVFPAATEKIYASVSFQGMTNGLIWQSKLYRDGNQIGFDPGTWQSGTSGTWWHWWSDTSPGNYEYEIWIDGQLMTTGNFVIEEAGPHFGPATFATAVDENDNCLSPQTTFPSGTSRVYTCFTYTGMQDGMAVRMVWLRDGQTYDEGTDTWESGEEGNFWWWIGWEDPQEGQLDPGRYDVQLYVDGQLMTSGTFVIQ